MKMFTKVILFMFLFSAYGFAAAFPMKPNSLHTINKSVVSIQITNESGSSGSFTLSFNSSMHKHTIGGYTTISIPIENASVKIHNTGKTTLSVETEN